MLSFPDNLPLPLREGYGFKTNSPISRTPFISGRAIQRLKHRSFPTAVTLSWVLNAEQARLFMGWFKWGIGYVDWFMCPIKSPMGLTPTKARFTDIYEGPELVGVNHWRFSVPAELFEIPVVNEAEFVSLLAGMDITVMNAELREQLDAWYTKNQHGSP
jgi:hypothetical protein